MARVFAQSQGQRGHGHYIHYVLLLTICTIAVTLGQDSTTIIRTENMIEEEDVGYVILNLATDTGLSDKYTAAILRTLQYSFLPQSQQYSDLFAINPDGDLITSAKVDRDERCPYKEVCEIALYIQVSPVEYFHIIKLTITLTDQNDNPPTFPNGIVLSIPESSDIGTPLTITPAEDPDSPPNSIVRYSLDDPSGKFSLEVLGDINEGPLEPQLRLQGALDHELRQTYEMDLTAYDGGSVPKSGTARIRVEVIDVNDHPARFLNHSYVATIKEDLARNRPVLKVTAEDADSGTNGEIVYGFNARTLETVKDVFAINPQTGEITVVGQLDYETQQSYSFTVTAQDKGPTSVPDQAKVTITIQDVNDNSPSIVVNTLVGKSAISISEFTPPNSQVAYFSVKDADSGDNAKFLCQLSDAHFRLDQFYPGEYRVFTEQTFDREQKSRYDVEINCSDKGTPIRSNSSKIPFLIKDENDNNPQFTQEKYRKDVLENLPVGTVIMTIQATDSDAGENATVTYSITNSSSTGIFSINPRTGDLILTGPLDREAKNVEKVIIKASDNGHPSLQNSTEVLLQVLDVDDEPPVFGQQVYTFEIAEHMSGNQMLGKVKASDADEKIEYKAFSFSLDPASNPENKFRVDTVSGEVFSMTGLDREANPEHSLRVLATGFENENGALSSAATIKVKVLDINDWSPVFTNPKFSNMTVSLSANTKPGKPFTNITAFDKDSGNNAKLTYSINGKKGPFAIDDSTGALSLALIGDSNNGNEADALKELYELVIRVQDNGLPPLSAQTRLKINCSVLINGESAVTLKPQNLTIVIIITVVSAVLIVGLILGIVCIVRGSWCRSRKGSRLGGGDVDGDCDGSEKGGAEDGGGLMYSVEYQVQAQYENKGYNKDLTDSNGGDLATGGGGGAGSGKKPVRYNSLQIPSVSDTRSRDYQLRHHHSDSVQASGAPSTSGGKVLIGGHLHPLPPRAASAPPHRPRPLHVKTDDTDQSRDSDSGRGSNEEVASEPGSPRWKNGTAKGAGSPPTPPPKLPRRASLRTARVLPGIHEGKVLTSPEPAGAPYDHPPPRSYHHPPPPLPPHDKPAPPLPGAHGNLHVNDPNTHPFKDNLPYYKNTHNPSAGGGDAAHQALTSRSRHNTTADDDVFLRLDISSSRPETPSKKRIKHVSQV